MSGQGTLFWLEIAGFLREGYKICGRLISRKISKFDEHGNALGGPFYYSENGLGERFRWLILDWGFRSNQRNPFSSRKISDPNEMYAISLPNNKYS